jgi:hypothetical protein
MRRGHLTPLAGFAVKRSLAGLTSATAER